MTTVNTYITYDGNCEEAFLFTNPFLEVDSPILADLKKYQ
jgi:hypothetical protein